MPISRWPTPGPRRLPFYLSGLAAGCLLPLALAPFDLWPLALVSAGALFWLLRRMSTARAAFWLGWFYGVGKYGVGASWVYVSIHVYGATPPWLAGLMVAAFVAGMALFNALMGLVFHLIGKLRNDEFATAVLFAVLWTATEWLLTWFLTGFPWLFAGYAFIDTPLAGLAPVGGVLLVSLAAVLTATLLVSIRQGIWIGAVPVVLWLAAWGLKWIDWTEPGETRTVALVQGNIPQELKWTAEGVASSMAVYRSLTATVQDREIVVWPEAAIPDYLRRQKEFIEAQRGAGDIVTGIFVAEANADGFDYYNAAMSTGEGVYHKRRLVPFGDYLPFESVLRGAVAFFDLPMSGTTPGVDEQPLLRAAGLDLAMAICWEIAYPKAVARSGADADLLVTISNDTWFGASIGPKQHLQIARMRALENGRYLLRATNNGITAIIGPEGEVVDRLPQFEAGVLDGSVQARSGPTPYGLWKDWAVLAMLAAILVAIPFLPQRVTAFNSTPVSINVAHLFARRRRKDHR